MSTISDTLKAIRAVLLLQDKVAQLTQTVESQGSRLNRLADAHADLRDRVSRLEGFLDGATAATRQRRIED